MQLQSLYFILKDLGRFSLISMLLGHTIKFLRDEESPGSKFGRSFEIKVFVQPNL